MSEHVAVVSVQSRECSPEILERLSGATLFPERPFGASVVSVVRRAGGSLFYVTAPAMIEADRQLDYFLSLLPEERPGGNEDARSRVVVGSLDDDSARWLSDKLLDSSSASAEELRARMRAFVQREQAAGAAVRLSCFESSRNLERLARQLNIPCDQAPARHIPLGAKGEGRAVFAAAGVPMPAGTPEVHSVGELGDGIADLLAAGHRDLVVKLSAPERGGSGMGNARIQFADISAPDRSAVVSAVAAALPGALFVDATLTWDEYTALIAQHGAVAEQWINGGEVRSPSFQGRVDTHGTVHGVSTHDQVLGGIGGMTYTGSLFPADQAYRRAVVDHGLAVGRELLRRGYRGGDYGVDFLAVHRAGAWQVLGCEVNLRATGAKHGFTMVTSLLGTEPAADGTLRTDDGAERFYAASDAIADPRYIGLTPGQLIDAVTASPLRYDPATRTGVVLHLLSAVRDYGRFGAVCVAPSRAQALELEAGLRRLVATLTPRKLTGPQLR